MRIGVISDTHGLLRPEAVRELRGVDHILHAGDVGKLEILERLGEIASVTAIRGNIDVSGACARLPAEQTVELAGRRIHLIHNVADLRFAPRVEEIDVVIFGHSHKPGIEMKDGVLYLNPGSAGPRRFKLPISVAMMSVDEAGIKPEIKILSLS
jgi:putative phosphoesterase